MPEFLVAVIAGLSTGATYALVSLGVVLIFRSTRTFNFAHGEFMLLPAYIVGSWQSLHRDFSVSIVVALALTAVIGMAFYLIVLQRATGLSDFMAVIATLGLASVLDGVMIIWFGPTEYTIKFPGLPTGSVRIDGARFSADSLILTAFTLLLALVVAAVLRFTQVGHRLRAAGQDPLLASQSGINIRRMYLGSWGIAAVLAAIAGIAYGTSNLVGTSMINVALSAFPAILIGGMDSIGGAIVGGLIVGVFQGFVATYLNADLLNVLTYALLLVVLLVFPQGLFGTRTAQRI
jgi:branched-chain amino acid transport system permease protein